MHARRSAGPVRAGSLGLLLGGGLVLVVLDAVAVDAVAVDGGHGGASAMGRA